ncbi:ribosomal protection-like ABC-F family protein [Kurthia gibsonii]|uniref:ribosomal protection-like ABC-F family protein n=1 Tax=Kurthia gibsonii TaxID=33946 RepID=UPI0031B6E61D
MTELCKCHNLSYEEILTDMNVSVKVGARIGITGINGAGKSTLLKLLANQIQPTTGHIEWFRKASTFLVEQEKKDFNREIPRGLTSIWQVPERPYALLSGGEKLKIRLAEAFAEKPQLLLLDEPTNHLDQEALHFLKKQLKKYRGTVIFVSHNRTFLNEVATEIWHIEDKKVTAYKGNYEAYRTQYEANRLHQQREYEKQQQEIVRIEQQMSKITSWSEQAHADSTKHEFAKEFYRVKAKRMDAQVKSKQKRLEKELRKHQLDQPKKEHQVHFEFQSTHSTGKHLIELKHVSKVFGEKVILEGVNLTINYGERIALSGKNGAGKTTFLQMLLGKEHYEGEIWLSPAAKIGYLTQQVFDLPEESTPSELFEQTTFEQRGLVQTLMIHLGFTNEQWNEPIALMSMGERVKCKLMQLVLDENNVLILDEPTNHLDLESREQLEKVLEEYDGTLIVVSHDSYFVEKITTRKLIIENQQMVTPTVVVETPVEKERMQLETRLQEVLGKLSFLTPKDAQYEVLDEEFNEITKRLQQLR